MKLLYHPDKALKKICSEVDIIDESIYNLLDHMKEIMNKHEGVGLAANQVGSFHKIFIMKDSKNKIWEFINPRMVFFDDVQYESEGCLSYPGIRVSLKRYKQVSVKALNRSGEEFCIGATDREALCIQHEMEHLLGENFLQNISREERRKLLKKVSKNVRK